MAASENFKKLVPVLSRSFKVPPERITLTARLKEDLDADSLQAAVALMDIEVEFNITVPDDRHEYKTVQDILNRIVALQAPSLSATASES